MSSTVPAESEWEPFVWDTEIAQVLLSSGHLATVRRGDVLWGTMAADGVQFHKHDRKRRAD